MGTIMPGLVKIRLRWGLAEALPPPVVGLAYVRIMPSIETSGPILTFAPLGVWLFCEC